MYSVIHTWPETLYHDISVTHLLFGMNCVRCSAAFLPSLFETVCVSLLDILVLCVST